MNKKSNKKQSVREFNLGRFKNMVIVALVAVIIGATAAFTMIVQDLKKQTITSEQATYLTVFDELAENFAQNLDISDKGRTVAEMTGYGVSDEDGAFYNAVSENDRLVDALDHAPDELILEPAVQIGVVEVGCRIIDGVRHVAKVNIEHCFHLMIQYSG